ncbi:MAG: alginate export family protein [Candidatus Omnitrophota bacterium]
MKQLLTALCVVALAICMTGTALAETQSVKVSGDLEVKGIARQAYTYQKSPNEADVTRVGIQSDWQNWFMSNTEVQIDADLTDNVSTTVRLVNTRDWNVSGKAIAQGTALANYGRGGYAAVANEFDVLVDLAYVDLKDFIYQPLTLSVGRQDLWVGKGFIVGANQQSPQGTITAVEYTPINSFDSVKAVLDYDPWTITGIYSKIFENAIQADDDVDLYGLNVGYIFDQYNADIEGYWFWKSDKEVERWAGIKSDNEVHTLGLRTSVDPIEDLTLNLEAAWQGGQYAGHRSQVNNRGRSAYAIDASAEWRYFTEKFAWKPVVGVEYILYSGNEAEQRPNLAAGDYEGWDPMYRGKYDTAIREFVGRFYASASYPAKGAGADELLTFSDASFTNQHQIIARGSIEPVESLLLEGVYAAFYTHRDIIGPDFQERGGSIGQEVDLQATWDYTEDVSFGLLTGWFFPGHIYDRPTLQDNFNSVASDLVGTMKVSF